MQQETEEELSLQHHDLAEGEWGDIVVIKPNGAYILYKCEPNLKNLQHLVGGYIEVIPGFTKFNGFPSIVLGDEEGKLKNKPINTRATIEWTKAVGHAHRDMLVGDIIVLSGSAKEWFERDDDDVA